MSPEEMALKSCVTTKAGPWKFPEQEPQSIYVHGGQHTGLQSLGAARGAGGRAGFGGTPGWLGGRTAPSRSRGQVFQGPRWFPRPELGARAPRGLAAVAGGLASQASRAGGQANSPHMCFLLFLSWERKSLTKKSLQIHLNIS